MGTGFFSQHVSKEFVSAFVIAVIVRQRLIRRTVSRLRGNFPRTKNFDKEDSLTVVYHIGR
jgi:hypothetical protein